MKMGIVHIERWTSKL